MADAYAKLTGFGVALVTSGPGSTNVVTPMSASYYDSTPVLYITGQVASFRLSYDGVRQTGFQETPILEVCRSFIKDGVLIKDRQKALPELRRLIELAKSGRKGPVVFDICDDVQRASV
jgi:acetolactate synthase-1/2/3 large subunit